MEDNFRVLWPGVKENDKATEKEDPSVGTVWGGLSESSCSSSLANASVHGYLLRQLASARAAIRSAQEEDQHLSADIDALKRHLLVGTVDSVAESDSVRAFLTDKPRPVVKKRALELKVRPGKPYLAEGSFLNVEVSLNAEQSITNAQPWLRLQGAEGIPVTILEKVAGSLDQLNPGISASVTLSMAFTDRIARILAQSNCCFTIGVSFLRANGTPGAAHADINVTPVSLVCSLGPRDGVYRRNEQPEILMTLGSDPEEVMNKPDNPEEVMNQLERALGLVTIGRVTDLAKAFSFSAPSLCFCFLEASLNSGSDTIQLVIGGPKTRTILISAVVMDNLPKGWKVVQEEKDNQIKSLLETSEDELLNRCKESLLEELQVLLLAVDELAFSNGIKSKSELIDQEDEPGDPKARIQTRQAVRKARLEHGIVIDAVTYTSKIADPLAKLELATDRAVAAAKSVGKL